MVSAVSKIRSCGDYVIKKQIKRENIDFNAENTSLNEISELQSQIKQLQMEVDVLKETLNLLKKDPGINVTELKNREKAVVIDAMKDRYSLPDLLRALKIAKSSYYYQETVLKQPDKHDIVRKKIIELFEENRSCYGYRRIYQQLKRLGITVSEKIVRSIMKTEHLSVMSKRMKNYSSYKGEITPEVENIINRDFHPKKAQSKMANRYNRIFYSCGKTIFIAYC